MYLEIQPMKGYVLSKEEMQGLHSLRYWIGTMIHQGKLAKSEHSKAADFAIDLSEILSTSMCIEIEETDS